MGLRFRKSISILPGVKINFGKTGASISAGVPGFRKTIHTSGKVTTSLGIPGTGIYYVDTKNNKSNKHVDSNLSYITTQSVIEPVVQENNNTEVHTESTGNAHMPSIQLTENGIRNIHKTSDDSVEWTEIISSPTPPDDTYNREMWSYYHSVAKNILSGDIDTYLEVIYTVNPLDDLLEYGSKFEFGTDDPLKIEVEFTVNESVISNIKATKSNTEYNNILNDFVCSMCIRIARDMFALLPIKNVIVHADLFDNTVISVNFDRSTMSKIKFGYIDSSDTILKFKSNINFNEETGYMPVCRL